MEEGKGPVDTSHLYEGKVVRSSAPSRKRAAGTLKADSGIPDDAVPDVAIPSWIDAIFGGPILVNREFVSPNKMVLNLQMGGNRLALSPRVPYFHAHASIRNCMVRDIKHDRIWLPGPLAPSTDDYYWTGIWFLGGLAERPKGDIAVLRNANSGHYQVRWKQG